VDKRLLKNITILRENETYLNKDFAVSFRNPEVLPQLLKNIDEELTSRGFYEEELIIDIITLKIICYKMKNPIPLFVSLTYDDSSLPDQILPKMHKILKILRTFLEKTNISADKISEDNKKLLESKCSPLIEDLIMLRPAKISIIGYDFVGKSSITEMIKSGSIPRKYKETTQLKKYKAKLFGMPILLWDIPDQGDISEKVWQSFILGSDAVILVLDSTKKNAEESKLMVEITDKIIPMAELLIVANKQDSNESLPPEEIENIIGGKIFPFEGNKAENSILIQKQAAKLLEIRAEGIDYSKKDYVIQRND
jgi:signal recognition particle receptor subunit beta